MEYGTSFIDTVSGFGLRRYNMDIDIISAFAAGLDGDEIGRTFVSVIDNQSGRNVWCLRNQLSPKFSQDQLFTLWMEREIVTVCNIAKARNRQPYCSFEVILVCQCRRAVDLSAVSYFMYRRD